jgi:uncharacterized membrane protein YjgN (DUF898 family)
MVEDRGETSSAFRFHGNWRAFLPIALSNLLLTIVTLGIYRFWATTRERQYLWSETEFIDDRLEWTGTGKELLIGFIIVVVFILLPFFAISFINQALLLRGYGGAVGIVTLTIFGLIYYLTGIARFRGLRYKLSRTYWHGIRGGSNVQGGQYGWSYVWKSVCGMLAAGLLVPWSMMTLWNERWNEMSFGPHKFDAVGEHGETFKRFLLFYLVPFVMVFVILIFGVIAAFAVGVGPSTADGSAPPEMGKLFAIGAGAILLYYVGFGFVALAFYAKFFRVAIGGLSLRDLDLNFSARTMDWFKLVLGDLALWAASALVTALPLAIILYSMGIFNGYTLPQPGEEPTFIQQAAPYAIIAFLLIPMSLVGPFIRYRHWKFFIVHMQAYGEVNLDDLTQSQTETSRHGEGLLDAFDVGAI